MHSRTAMAVSAVALPKFNLFSSIVTLAVKLPLLPMFVIDCTRAYKKVTLMGV